MLPLLRHAFHFITLLRRRHYYHYFSFDFDFIAAFAISPLIIIAVFAPCPPPRRLPKRQTAMAQAAARREDSLIPRLLPPLARC
jgi:hypothetical protein